MNAVASTLISDLPPRVFGSDLTRRMDIVNAAIRKLHDHGIKVIEQDLRRGTDECPLLYVDQEPPRAAGIWFSRPATRKNGKTVRVAAFLEVEIAWPAERRS